MLKKLLMGATVATGLTMASGAHAGLIDFTDSSVWGGAANQTSFSAGGVTLNASDPMSFQSFDGTTGPTPCDRLACNGDGIGVDDDEVTFSSIDFGESLTVMFDEPVGIHKVDFLDLFGVNDGTNDDEAEVAQWTTDGLVGGGNATGIRNDPDNVGWLLTQVNDTGVTEITFYAGDPAPGNTDFAVAAISVPAPATLGLLGAGLLGLGALSRRRSR